MYSAFLMYLKNEFPGCLDNHWDYELLENLIDYAYRTYGHSKGRARNFIAGIVPEVSEEDLEALLPDFSD